MAESGLVSAAVVEGLDVVEQDRAEVWYPVESPSKAQTDDDRDQDVFWGWVIAAGGAVGVVGALLEGVRRYQNFCVNPETGFTATRHELGRIATEDRTPTAPTQHPSVTRGAQLPRQYRTCRIYGYRQRVKWIAPRRDDDTPNASGV